MKPTEIVKLLLENPTDIDHVGELLSDAFVYVSLNYRNDDLNRIMPWAGTHKGPQSFVEVFSGVYQQWTVDAFETEAAFDDGENVAIFGRFTLRSKTLQKARQSPFAIFAKVTAGGKVSYFQYMEDTFATADTFRKGGMWEFEPLPNKVVRI